AARREDEGQRLLERERDREDLGTGHDNHPPRRRVRCRRDEDGHGVRHDFLDGPGRDRGHEADRPAPGARVLHENDLAEEALPLAEHGAHDPVRRGVEPAGQREPFEERVPPPHDPCADRPLGRPPDQEEEEQEQQQSEPRDIDPDRRIDDVPEQPVQALEDPPENERRDGDRRDDDEPRDQPPPHRPTRHLHASHPSTTSRTMASCRRHIGLRSRSSSSGWSYPQTWSVPWTTSRTTSSRIGTPNSAACRTAWSHPM